MARRQQDQLRQNPVRSHDFRPIPMRPIPTCPSLDVDQPRLVPDQFILASTRTKEDGRESVKLECRGPHGGGFERFRVEFCLTEGEWSQPWPTEPNAREAHSNNLERWFMVFQSLHRQLCEHNVLAAKRKYRDDNGLLTCGSSHFAINNSAVELPACLKKCRVCTCNATGGVQCITPGHMTIRQAGFAVTIGFGLCTICARFFLHQQGQVSSCTALGVAQQKQLDKLRKTLKEQAVFVWKARKFTGWAPLNHGICRIEQHGPSAASWDAAL